MFSLLVIVTGISWILNVIMLWFGASGATFGMFVTLMTGIILTGGGPTIMLDNQAKIGLSIVAISNFGYAVAVALGAA